MFSTKSSISHILKIAKLSNLNQNPFQNIAHLSGREKVQTIQRILNDHILKTQNWKTDFSFVSVQYITLHCATFCINKKKTAVFEGEGGLHDVNKE